MGRLRFGKLDGKILIRPMIYSTVVMIFLFSTVAGILYYTNLAEFTNQVKTQQEIEAEAIRLLIRKYIATMKNDVSIFAEVAIVKNFVENPAANKSPLYDSLKSVLERRRYYHQFRILNLAGHEIFRINYEDNKANLVPDDQLQDKSKRYYYQEASSLEKDQVMVSNYDYNIENEKIERPLRPSLRITAPIYINNKKRAYLVVNFNTHVLNNEIEIFNRLTRFDVYIINNQRQFLCWKSYHVKLDEVYEKPEKSGKLADRIFSAERFFHLGNAYFFKIKIPLNEFEDTQSKTFIYLAIELPAGRYLANEKEIFNKIVLYTLLLFIFSAAVVYIFLFLSLLINKDTVQLRRTSRLLELLSEGVVITDAAGIIEYINPAFEKIFKCSAKDTLGQKMSKFKSNVHGPDFHEAMKRRLDNTGKWEGNIIDTLSDGTRQVKRLRIEKLFDSKSGKVIYLGIYNDITKIRNSDRLIKRLNSLDYLTGLPNKRILLARINKTIEQFSGTDSKLSIVSIAIRNLKDINDFYGFDIGDKIVLIFVERLKGKIKSNDIIGRISDNHFLLISTCESPESLSNDISGLLQSCTSVPFTINELEIYLSINVGISIYPDNGTNGEELIKAASLARGARISGDKLTINFYSDKMLLQAQEKSNLLSMLEKAIQQEELYLEFQPKIDSRDGSVVGSEALIRWNSSRLGVVPPSVFIPLAEDNGLINQISRWIIRRLCAQIKEWKDKDLPVKPVSFNLSVHDFDKEDFPAYFFACAKEHGLKGEDIQLELTERVFAKNRAQVIEKITQLRNKGFKILIDDFGTGYSSLEYIREFKVDILKIDRAFIKDYPEKSDGQIVKTICELAHSLKLEIICEGVETKSQIDFLDSVGCYIIQGFYYSPSASAKVFEHMLVKGRIIKS